MVHPPIAQGRNCSESRSSLFSAKDAVFNGILGQHPRVKLFHTKTALKVRFTSGTSSIIIPAMIRAYSAWFRKNDFPGALPQA